MKYKVETFKSALFELESEEVQRLIHEVGGEIREEIENEIMVDLLGESGWHKVELMTLFISEEFYDWIEENVKYPYRQHNMKFVFEDESDANWFKLRWLT